MPTVETLTPALLDEVLPLLRRLNPAMHAYRWRLAFDGRWHPDDGTSGCVLLEGGRPVGVMGMLFSERDIGGRRMPFCNLHSWYVEPEHRAHSLLLLRRALALRDCTLTDFSASPRVVEICRRLGFRGLDDAVVAVPAVPWPRPRAAAVEELDATRAAQVLDAQALRLFHDHLGIDCVQLWLHDGNGGCLLTGSIQRLGRFTCLNLHHIGDRALFARHHAAFRAWMRGRGLHAAIACSRLLAGTRLPFSMKLRSNVKLYRPAGDVPAEAVDALYTEMPLLKLPVEITAVGRLRAALARWTPGARVVAEAG